MSSLTELVKARLEAGDSPAEVAKDLGLETVSEEAFDGLAVVLPGWQADDGNAECHFEVDSGESAAQEYVDGGDWSEGEETWWAYVYAWRRGFAVDSDGGVIEVEVDRRQHTVEVTPDEPDCTSDDGHDYSDGGDEFGGVRGHGGGVTITTSCTRCGLIRTENTWAQCRLTGRQGLHSVAYKPAGTVG